jgi:2-phosphoglycolate phosphatase
VSARRPRWPHAIVFDLDGTLADTREDIAAACNHALVSLGRAPRPVLDIAAFVGDGARKLVSRAFELPESDPVLERALAVFSAYYESHAAVHARWMPGAREALDACSGLPLAVATNKPRSATIPLLEALSMTQLFRVVFAGGDGPLKPDPQAIHAALGPLSVDAADAWVIGDGPQDIGAGRSAGSFTVGVLGGFAPERALRASEPDHLLKSLHDLPALLALAAM